MSKKDWSDWYVRHLSGKGIRVKIKPSINAVHGGAGSVSQMVNAPYWQYQFNRIDNVSAIRFHPEFIKNNSILIDQALTVEELKEIKLKESIPKDQLSLEDTF